MRLSSAVFTDAPKKPIASFSIEVPVLANRGLRQRHTLRFEILIGEGNENSLFCIMCFV
jgi:hypothetical protein